MSLCCNGTCRRTTPIRVFRSSLTERFYAVTRWKGGAGGFVAAQEKHDVTSDVIALVNEAEKRGGERVRAQITALHHEAPGGGCAACGTTWPCETVRVVGTS